MDNIAKVLKQPQNYACQLTTLVQDKVSLSHQKGRHTVGITIPTFTSLAPGKLLK